MHIHRHARAPLTRWLVPLLGAGLLLMATMLVACGQPAKGQPHMLEGKLNLLHVPAPYVLPGQIVRGPDGNLWFPAIAYANFTTDKPSGAIGMLTPHGTFHLFPMPMPNTFPREIAFGRDGNLWFSAFEGNGKLAPIGDQAPHFTGGKSELGQMSQDGTFRLFALPSPSVSDRSIAVGADGNLWFTDVTRAGGPTYAYVNKIGRVTPSGVFTEFPVTLRKATDFADLLIAGPDGNLWFSIEGYLPDYSAFGEMGRITPQGTVTIFDLGKFIVPRDMTIGPDNNIWFSAGDVVGRMTKDGQVRLFDPSPGAKAFERIGISGITSSIDGSLWFATVNAAVGRVTTDGTFKLYPLPSDTFFDNGGSSLDMGNLRGIV